MASIEVTPRYGRDREGHQRQFGVLVDSSSQDSKPVCSATQVSTASLRRAITMGVTAYSKGIGHAPRKQPSVGKWLRHHKSIQDACQRLAS